ncbi:hypothetical protein HY988_07415 [Candidatus Micrarchaeota archaeon]|nr:hypothetical protein [Candidatus Micrarchaeota archaeon]
MENTEKILLAVTLIVAAFAIYIAYTSSAPKPGPKSTDAALAIVMKAMEFGSDATNYYYSFSQSSDGYTTLYKSEKLGNLSFLSIENPLSKQKIYFTDNDTVICMAYGGPDVCGSGSSTPSLSNYVQSLRAIFLSKDNIAIHKTNFEYILNNRYVLLSPDIANITIDGTPCSEVNYLVDYTNLTNDEAVRFGIGPDSPKTFNVSLCLDPKSGKYVRSLSYSLNNLSHTSNYKILEFKTTGLDPIVPPANATADVVPTLLLEKQDEQNILGCYVKAEREGCVLELALQLENKNVCTLLDKKKDRCFVSLVPLTKDVSLCDGITDSSFKDDCYIELAGAYKDKTYCAKVIDSAKVQNCLSASAVKPVPAPGINSNSSNVSNSSTGG